MRDDTIILVLMLDNRRVTLFQGDEVTVDSSFFLFSFLLLNFLNELAEELSEHCSHGGVYLIRVISRKLQIYDQS